MAGAIPPGVAVFADRDRLAEGAADAIVGALRQAVRERGRAMAALAGGSTPERTYAALARPGRRSLVDWARTSLFLGDERFVPPDDPSCNFAMVRRALLAPAGVPEGRAFAVPTRVPTAAAAAAGYAATLAAEFGIAADGAAPRFDLVLLGLGEDGHTASLFPHAASLGVTDRWVMATPPGAMPPLVDRITLTFPVLNAARAVVFLVSGRGKAAALREVLEGRPTRDECPAAGVRPGDGTVAWLVDEAAASELSHRPTRAAD